MQGHGSFYSTLLPGSVLSLMPSSLLLHQRLSIVRCSVMCTIPTKLEHFSATAVVFVLKTALNETCLGLWRGQLLHSNWQLCWSLWQMIIMKLHSPYMIYRRWKNMRWMEQTWTWVKFLLTTHKPNDMHVHSVVMSVYLYMYYVCCHYTRMNGEEWLVCCWTWWGKFKTVFFDILNLHWI